MLSNTGVLGKPTEYFNGHGLRLFTDPAYPDDPSEQLARVLTDGATPNGVYGIKVFPWLVDAIAPHVRWTDALPGLRFVYLERRDLLGQAISLLRANQTQQWRSTLSARGETSYDGAAILGYLHQIVREQARWASFFARNGIEPLRLIYEDFVGRPEAAVRAVAELMHVAIPPATDPYQTDLVVQRDSVTEVLRSRFLDEFCNGSYVDVI